MGSTRRPHALIAAAIASSTIAMLAGSAWAQVSTERPGSILIFPKVVRTASLNTRIELSNTYSMVNYVRCFYVDAQPGDSQQPLCSHTDFDLRLTKQQPTQWSVADGRPVRSTDAFGSPNSGLDPGSIPPVAQGFTGALICVEVGADGLPSGLSKLTGAATIVDTTGDENRYNAIAVPAGPAVNKDTTLDLEAGTCRNSGATSCLEDIDCPAGANRVCDYEFRACPQTTEINVAAPNRPDPILGMGSSQGAILTVVPCQFNIEAGIATHGTANFNAFNEFETGLSGSFTYSCIGNIDLGSLGQVNSLVTPFGYISMTANPPVVGVLTTVHTSASGDVATASRNLHGTGTGANTQISIVE